MNSLMIKRPTIQSIIQANPEFTNHLPNRHKQVFNHLNICKTLKCGIHSDECVNCGHSSIYYNSCRDRHCPQCQAVDRELWIYKERQNVLNIQYFHVVFTLPSELNPFVLKYPKEMYNLLFETVAETLNELALDSKYLGAQIGFTSVLHTWGQNISLHPHLHVIVSGGGQKGLVTWIDSKKDFFIPVKVMSRKFRGKFLSKLQLLPIYDSENESHENILNSCYRKDWVVYCKKPFKNADTVIKYLSRYTHKIAISNGRIKSHDNHQVTFSYKDYKDHNKIKEMILDEEEFLKRFFLHVLPKRFIRIRHYGFLCSTNKKARLTVLKKLTNTPILQFRDLPRKEILSFVLKKENCICSVCKHHRYQRE